MQAKLAYMQIQFYFVLEILQQSYQENKKYFKYALVMLTSGVHYEPLNSN